MILNVKRDRFVPVPFCVLQKGVPCAMMAPTTGELAQSRLRVGCVALTRKPDLGNANVGIYGRIALL